MKFPSLRKKVKTGYLYICLDELGNKERIRTVFFFRSDFYFYLFIYFSKESLKNRVTKFAALLPNRGNPGAAGMKLFCFGSTTK